MVHGMVDIFIMSIRLVLCYTIFAKLPKSFIIISIKGGFWVVVILFGVVRFRGFAVVFGTQVMSMERFWVVVIFII